MDVWARRRPNGLGRYLAVGALAVVVCGALAILTGLFTRPAHASPRPTTASNRALAQTLAGTLIGEVPLPAGAAEVSSDPESSRTHPWLDVTEVPLSTLLVDVGRFWRVPGDPKSVMDWIAAHPPPGFTKSGKETGSANGTMRFWGVHLAASIPGPISRRIAQEELTIGATAADGGGTALRADAQVVWMIPRPARETIPAGVRSVLVSVDHHGGGAFKDASVTAPGKVARLVSYVDSLQLVQPSQIPCPAIGPSTRVLELRFLGPAGTRAGPLARAVEDGCDGLTFYVRGHRERPLDERDEVGALLHRLGVRQVRIR
jgi:hypothetical protein